MFGRISQSLLALKQHSRYLPETDPIGKHLFPALKGAIAM
jgi:hypothetical protein